MNEELQLYTGLFSLLNIPLAIADRTKKEGARLPKTSDFHQDFSPVYAINGRDDRDQRTRKRSYFTLTVKVSVVNSSKLQVVDVPPPQKM